MQIHPCGVGNSIKKFPYHLSIHVTDTICGEFCIKSKIWPAGQINGTQNQCLVHGKYHAAKSFDSFFVSQSFPDGISKDDPGIFDCMMTVDFQITSHLQIQIKETMSGESGKHVIKKAYSGSNILLSVSV